MGMCSRCSELIHWQVLFTAFAFCYLEKSYRDFSPLKQLIVSKDWIAVANRLVPVLGAGDDYAKLFKQFCTV
jgi:hypothetical protein